MKDMTPLEQIQQTEAETAARIQAAGEAMQVRIRQAQENAEAIRREAVEAGRQEGEIIAQKVIDEAKKEAEQILAEAHHEATELQRKLSESMDSLVGRAIVVVLGTTQGEVNQ